MSGTSESDIENGFIRPVCEAVLGYSAVQNRPLVLRESAVDSGTPTQRPDLVLFADRVAFEGAPERYGSDASRSAPADGPGFCQSAALVVDAKRFDKGVGADETPVPAPKSRRTEPTAIEDVQQVGR